MRDSVPRVGRLGCGVPASHPSNSRTDKWPLVRRALVPVDGFPWLWAVVLSLALVLVVAWYPYLPTHDGPQHVFLAHLANHYADPAGQYHLFFEPSAPLTGLGFHQPFSLLCELMPWRTALRFMLALMCLLWAWSFARFVTALDRRRGALALLGFPLALQWSLYMGFFAYFIGSALGLLAVAEAVAPVRFTPLRTTRLLVLVVVQTVAHVFPAQLTWVALAAITVVAKTDEAVWKRYARLALVAVPPAVVTALALGGQGSDPAILAEPSLLERLALFPRTFLPGAPIRAWLVVALAMAALAVALPTAWRARRSPLAAIWLCAAGLLGMAAFGPARILSWDFFAERFTPMGMALALALLPVERLAGRARAALAPGIALASGASLAVSASLHADIVRASAPALAGLDSPLRRTGPRLPLVLDPFAGLGQAPLEQPIPFYAPLLNLGAIYATEHGGIPPRIFATRRAVHPFVLLVRPRHPFPTIPDPGSQALAWSELAEPSPGRDELVDWLAAFGPAFDDVVLYGRPGDGARLLALGYRADFQTDRLLIAHFEGCVPTVSFEGGDASETGVVYGWLAGRGVQYRAEPEAAVGKGVPLAAAACAPIWYAPAGPAGGSRWRCTGDPQHGAYVVMLERPGMGLRCRAAD